MLNESKKLFCGIIPLSLVILLISGCGGRSETTVPQSTYAQADASVSGNGESSEKDLQNDDTSEGISKNENDYTVQEDSSSDNDKEAESTEEHHSLNYALFSDDNISVNLEQITKDGALFTVENKLDEPLYFTNYILSFDGFNLSDSAGLIYDSSLIAPHSTGNVLTKTAFYTDNPSYIYGRAYYGTEDESIDEDITFSYGDKESLSEGSVLVPRTTVYEDDNIEVEFDIVDTEEYGGAYYIVVNKSDYLMSYVNTSIAFDGVSYSDEAGLVYNSTDIAPKSTGMILTELTETVKPEVKIISGSGGYYIEDIGVDKDFSYADIEVE